MISLAKIRLWPYVLVSLLFILLLPVFYPAARLSFLVPCIVVLFYQKRLIVCLWASFMAGFLLDLFSSATFFGLHVTSLCLATAFIYPQKRHFFADSLSTLPILTFLMTVLSTVLQVAFMHIFQSGAAIGAPWFFTNILAMPLFDSAYAFCLFLLPSLLLGKPRRHGKEFFLHTSLRQLR